MIDVRAYLIEQEPALKQFARKYAGQGVDIFPLAQDWASRRYFRVDGASKNYVLMQAVPDHIPTATMGHKLSAYIRVGRMLKEHGIHAPDILALDEENGFVLLEDLGDVTLGAALAKGADVFEIYTQATDVLIKLRDSISLKELQAYPKYKDSYIRKGRQRIVDWYIPATRFSKNDDGMVEEYEAVWDEVASQVPAPPIGFIHGDYHLQNLMLLKNGEVGVLDFQDAMAGPAPYDLGNLLENIRTDVPREVYDAMIKRYGMDDVTRAWFRIMATQFHCRILGQVLRLAILSGKRDLMDYIPRVQGYLKEAMKDPVLKPLAKWFEQAHVDLNASVFDVERIKPFIRDDAF